MNIPVECPICLDCIDVLKNCVTTECGHCFHASCLMRSVAHNGFGCPYCRTAMAEEVAEEDDEEDTVWSEVSGEEEELFQDFALRGFRFFMNNVEGAEHEEEDIAVEEEAIRTAVQEEILPAKPTAAFITQKLVEQGITMEHLLKVLLRDHDEYDSHDEEFEQIDDDVFAKLRIIISNYEPEVQPVVVPEIVEEQELPAVVDYSSQPKQYANITVRRQMMH